MADTQYDDRIARYADMMAALGTETRLRIVRLLLSAHPYGLVVGEIGSELGIPASTLSHHLEKLKNEDLVKVRRRAPSCATRRTPRRCRTSWRFLAECCTRNKAVNPDAVTCC